VAVICDEADLPLREWATRNAAGDALGTVRFPAACEVAGLVDALVLDALVCEDNAD